jgi:GNAT superfamily N-acetyltransferase
VRPKARAEPRPRPPAPLETTHELDAFECGHASLDDWLRKRAHKNERAGASRTYVVCIEQRVIAYYCLAVGSISKIEAAGRVKRNMPDPIPAMVIGRLAVDRTWQGKRLGTALLADAIKRTLQAAEVAGIRAIILHAITEEAKRFYEQHGFIESPVAPLTMMITLEDAKANLD